MSGRRLLVATWGQNYDEAWDTIAADLDFGRSSTRAKWRDDTTPFAVGWVDPAGRTRTGDPGPAVEAPGEYVVVFDGRLDARRHHDGEIRAISDAYQRWGLDCATHLDGEFSFILWDRARRRALLGCDSSGTRALAYFHDGQTFATASRVLSLLRPPHVPRGWNRLYLAHVLGGTWTQAPGTTAFASISRTRASVATVLENGRLTEHPLTYISPTPTPRRAEEAFEEFRMLLAAATRTRFSGPKETCLALSGGLDSTLIGAVLARHEPTYDALSLVADRRPDLDESSPIQAFLAQYPHVRWHRFSWDVDGPPPEQTPLDDDPIVSADPLKCARRGLLQAIKAFGFTSVLSGDGGDEVFAMSRRIGDLAHAHRWMKLAHVLLMQNRKRTLLWRGVIVPRLPNATRPLWTWREERRLRTLPWLSPVFRADDATLEAREQARVWIAVGSTSAALRGILDHPANVGSSCTEQLAASRLGLELRKPMLDRAIIDFALSLPPELLWISSESKPFLRAAGTAWLPSSIVHLGKQVGLHRFLRDATLVRAARDGVERWLQADVFLTGLVDARGVRDSLQDQAHFGLSQREADSLYALIATAGWMRSVRAEYGG